MLWFLPLARALYHCDDGQCGRSIEKQAGNKSQHSLIDILNVSNTDGKGFLLISSLDVVGFSDGFRALGQARQAIDGVGGHGNHVAFLQSLHDAAQDFRLIYGSITTGIVKECETNY